METDEILSEEEVDALMDGVASGEVDTGTGAPPGVAVPYDLTNQDRIVRGRLPVLEKINERFGGYLQNGLEQMLQRPVEVSVEGLQTVRIADYIHSLGVPVSLNLVAVDSLPGEALVVFDPALVSMVVDIYFGGSGQPHGLVVGREFTPTEIRVSQLVLNQVFHDLKDAWEPVLTASFRHLRSEVNPQYSSLASSREMLVISSFRLEAGETGGEFHVGFPFPMLEPVRGLLDGGQQKGRQDNEERWLQAMKQKLQEANVQIFGRVAETELALRDVFNLKAGDVITVTAPEEVTLLVGDRPVLQGRFGLHKGRNAVRVTGRFDDPEKS
jgi:flagellar motor switch protein FliM